jgi:N-acetyl-anhydromuramyl-L-alanine amidase AmpD
MDTSINPKRIIWHHSAADAPNPQTAAINEWHKARDFPLSKSGYYVGYHYVIEKDGTVVQCREDTELGAHDTGENMDSIGICLVGNFETSRPSVEQEASFAHLLRRLMFLHNIPLASIEPHRRDDTTDCPGKNMPESWPLGLL